MGFDHAPNSLGISTSCLMLGFRLKLQRAKATRSVYALSHSGTSRHALDHIWKALSAYSDTSGLKSSEDGGVVNRTHCRGIGRVGFMSNRYAPRSSHLAGHSWSGLVEKGKNTACIAQHTTIS
jgi:hypothetical protein